MTARPEPVFPPLFAGQAVSGRTDPFAKACTQAMLGCESGLVVHNLAADTMRAAIVFAPEVPLEQAMAVLIACGVGFQNALGALAPPEVAVHIGWQGEIYVNGARCGRLRAASSTSVPDEEPAWIVVGLELPLIPESDAPGETPDQTCLYEEGCVEVDSTRLLEAWIRHSLVWINTLAEDGNRNLHAQWQGLAWNVGEDVTLDLGGTVFSGTFVGTDEDFGMLLRQGSETRILPLRLTLETGGAR